MDAGPHGLDGDIIGATWIPGYIGGALEFDGTSANVEIEYEEMEAYDGMSVSMWVRPDQLRAGSWDTLFSHGSAGAYHGCCGDSYFLGYYLNGVSWYTGDAADGMNLLWDNSDYTGHIGGWHHLAATWNTDTGERVVYVDGVATVNDMSAPAYPYYDAVPARIGADTNSGSAVLFFDGGIDEVKMFACPLSADQVAEDFAVNWPF